MYNYNNRYRKRKQAIDNQSLDAAVINSSHNIFLYIYIPYYI